jgi:hypothetical protein
MSGINRAGPERKFQHICLGGSKFDLSPNGDYNVFAPDGSSFMKESLHELADRDPGLQ